MSSALPILPPCTTTASAASALPSNSAPPAPTVAIAPQLSSENTTKSSTLQRPSPLYLLLFTILVVLLLAAGIAVTGSTILAALCGLTGVSVALIIFLLRMTWFSNTQDGETSVVQEVTCTTPLPPAYTLELFLPKYSSTPDLEAGKELDTIEISVHSLPPIYAP
ncbi:hypothetical protein DFS34DRAFT_609184 [Phlyctochytrium arcticum]|nr:hypothetical protein DFS34DRAFT_609184 [Phlyctochytrium arcticum]